MTNEQAMTNHMESVVFFRKLLKHRKIILAFNSSPDSDTYYLRKDDASEHEEITHGKWLEILPSILKLII